jgi:hypothetical protein
VDYVNSEDKSHRAASQEIFSPLLIFHTPSLRRFNKSISTVGDFGDKLCAASRGLLSPLSVLFTALYFASERSKNIIYPQGKKLIPAVHKTARIGFACAWIGAK